jgi:hypothetical protein
MPSTSKKTKAVSKKPSTPMKTISTKPKLGRTLRASVQSLVVAPSGDIYWCSEAHLVLRHLDRTTYKIRDIDCKVRAPLALLGTDQILGASFDYDRQEDFALIARRDTGEVIKQLQTPYPLESIGAFAVSPDSLHFAVVSGHMNAQRAAIDLFSAQGQHLQRIDIGQRGDGATELCQGAIFSEDSQELLYITNGKLCRTTLTGETSFVPCQIPYQGNGSPRLSRYDNLLLSHREGSIAYLIDEKTGNITLKTKEADVVTFGLSRQLVWAHQEVVKILNFRGTEQKTFSRNRKTRLVTAALFADMWVAGSYSSLELYDLNQLK